MAVRRRRVPARKPPLYPLATEQAVLAKRMTDLELAVSAILEILVALRSLLTAMPMPTTRATGAA